MNGHNGVLVPLVMLPRFTSFVGTSEFLTAPMDASAYQTAVLTIWRGEGPEWTESEFHVTAEESTDRVEWTVCAGTNVEEFDPGIEEEGVMTATLKKRWFRLKAALVSGDDPKVTCWAAGHFERREP